jgi:hypothetical protein
LYIKFRKNTFVFLYPIRATVKHFSIDFSPVLTANLSYVFWEKLDLKHCKLAVCVQDALRPAAWLRGIVNLRKLVVQ